MVKFWITNAAVKEDDLKWNHNSVCNIIILESGAKEYVFCGKACEEACAKKKQKQEGAK